jgi:hypothetical protein
MKEDFDNPAYLKTQMRVDEQGIRRWKIGKQVPSKVFLERLGLTPEEIAAHAAACEADMDEFAAKYQRRQSERTPEEIAEEKAEALAAHGPGVEMVNVFTGEHYIT